LTYHCFDTFAVSESSPLEAVVVKYCWILENEANLLFFENLYTFVRGEAGMIAIRHTKEVSIQNFTHLRVEVDTTAKTVWLYMQPRPRPCFNIDFLKEIREYQRVLQHYQGKLPHNGELVSIQYQVLASNDPGVFNLGGDLALFTECIRNKNLESLRSYARACIDVLYPNAIGYNLPITTISLVTGDALGGGFEAALSSQIIIAERGVQMGLPEILFNLFPGMGAYQLLCRRLNPALAEKMILSGRLYSSEELYQLGIIDVLAERGEAVEAVNTFRRSHSKRQNGYMGVTDVRNLVNPISYDELLAVSDIWANAALHLEERDLKTMTRLVRNQDKLPIVDEETLHTRASA
jgi:DSF synthase